MLYPSVLGNKFIQGLHVLYLSGWSLFAIASNSFNSVPESDMLMTTINTFEI